MVDQDQAQVELRLKIESLRIQAGLSVIGWSDALGISTNYTRELKSGKRPISRRTLKKVSNFFNIEIESLISNEPIVLGDIEKIDTIMVFYEANKNNNNFFEARKDEKNTVNFYLKKILSHDKFFEKERVVQEVREFIKTNYNIDVASKGLSRQLTRMVESGILEKEDKTGTKSIFSYKEKSS